VSGLFRRSRRNVGTCTSRSVKCRYAFGEVGLATGLVLRVRVGAGMCSASFNLVSGHVRRGRCSVATCPARSLHIRDISGDDVFVSGLVRHSPIIVRTCSAWSA